MTSSAKSTWLVPTLLIILTAVPVVAGAVRVAELTGGAEVTPENARFVAAPVPVLLHIVGATLFCVLGAFQFVPGSAAGSPAGTGSPGGCWYRPDSSPPSPASG